MQIVITEDGNSMAHIREELAVELIDIPSCCNAEYVVGFAESADGEILDSDAETCPGAGAISLGGAGTVYVALRSNSEIGIQGWSFGILATGDATIDSVTTDGTAAAPAPDGVFNGGFNKTSLALPENNEGQAGAVSAIVLCFGCPAVVDPAGTAALLAVNIVGPESGAGGVTFQSGLVGEGQPVDNVFTEEGASAEVCNIGTASLDITFEILDVGPFIRGNANDDFKVDIADPIWILNELFRGGPATACQPAADANFDGTITIADTAYLIGYLFGGGDEPPAPFPGCGVLTPEEAGDLTCDGGAASCP